MKEEELKMEKAVLYEEPNQLIAEKIQYAQDDHNAMLTDLVHRLRIKIDGILGSELVENHEDDEDKDVSNSLVSTIMRRNRETNRLLETLNYEISRLNKLI